MNNLPFRRSGSLSVVQKLPFYYGFVIVFISALGIIASIPGQTMGVSVFTDHFIETLDISRIQISTAYMVGTLSSSFMAPFMGLFYDRKGPRVTSALSTIVLAFFLLFLAFSDRILVLLSGGLPVDSSIIALVLMTVGFFGIRMSGQGALTMVSRATLARWFSTHRGITSGVLGVITSFSFSYAPRALQGLINHYTAGGAFIAMALLLLVLFLPLSILLYRKDPESCGLKMEQGIPVRRKKRRRVVDTGLQLTIGEVKRRPLYWVLVGTFGFFALFNTGFTFHIVSIFSDKGVSPTQAVSIFLPIAIVSIASSFFSSYASDRIQLTHLFRAYVLSSLLASVSMLIINSPLGIPLMIIAFGLSSGFFGTLLAVTFPKLYGTEHIGAISGLASSVTVAGSALGPWLFSVIREATGTYEMTGFMGIILTGLLFIGLLIIPFPLHNQYK